MGLNYSISLFFELDRIEDALRGVAAITTPTSKSIKVVSPSGRELLFPFYRYSDDQICVLQLAEELYLGADLRFAVDDEINDRFEPNSIDISGIYADIGSFGISIALGRRYVWLRICAATTQISLLLEKSSSIHQSFLEVLSSGDGLAALIDIESDDKFLLLEHPRQFIQLDRYAFLNEDSRCGNTEYDVDGFTTALLAECDRLREQAQGQPS